MHCMLLRYQFKLGWDCFIERKFTSKGAHWVCNIFPLFSPKSRIRLGIVFHIFPPAYVSLGGISDKPKNATGLNECSLVCGNSHTKTMFEKNLIFSFFGPVWGAETFRYDSNCHADICVSIRGEGRGLVNGIRQ